MTKETERVIANNRKAYHDYFIDEVMEAGLVLTGTEIKSVRAGRVNLRDSYARVEDGEVWLLNSHIAAYDPGTRYNHDPDRPRKLLLHRNEIRQLARKANEKGFTLVPTKLYLKDSFAKIELAVARGRKTYDKREALAEREAQREMERHVAQR
ncbi:MAG: SsrA-binding protein SmpB [Dehalococcoidales bacterium]|nr:SsrA-binding protein SmpB [Dehalococcoidales bacterium]